MPGAAIRRTISSAPSDSRLTAPSRASLTPCDQRPRGQASRTASRRADQVTRRFYRIADGRALTRTLQPSARAAPARAQEEGSAGDSHQQRGKGAARSGAEAAAAQVDVVVVVAARRAIGTRHPGGDGP